jgi:single-stranded DNA-binding protein
MNITILRGNLARDPELRTVNTNGKQTSVVNFTVATSREYTNFKRPSNLPRSPHKIMQWKDKWKGWADFLGKEDK